MITEFTFENGAVLKMNMAPFDDAKNLYQAVLSECQPVRIASEDEFGQLMKDLLCVSFSSKKIDAALEKCFARCLYDEKPISKETWEPVEARENYIKAIALVARLNIEPFMKGLFAQYKEIRSTMTDVTSQK